MTLAYFNSIVYLILAFAAGRYWFSSEAIFVQRQNAYANFLKSCVIAIELLTHDSDDELKSIIPTLRIASAEFALFSSPKANALSGKYLGLVARLISLSESDMEGWINLEKEAQETYTQLVLQMRKDTLGWTLFGVKNWIFSWKRDPM